MGFRKEVGVVKMLTPNRIWLLVIDLDKTLWDSEDISALKPPFRKTSEYVFEDSRGVKVNVHKDIVDVLKWAKKNGAVIAVISWNNESVALEALKVCDVLKLVDFYVIEDHPRKDIMFSKLVETLRRRSLDKVVECTVYIDDSEIFLEQVSKTAPHTCTVRAWRDFVDRDTLLKRLQSCLVKCGLTCLVGESF